MPSPYRTVPPIQTDNNVKSKSIDLTDQVDGIKDKFTLTEPLQNGVTFLTINGLISFEGTHYTISEDRTLVELFAPPEIDDHLVIYTV
jgi:hypothetical protein